MKIENKKQVEINAAVKKVTDRFGIEIITDQKRFCAALKDLAPEFSKESKAYFVALSENIGELCLRENDAVLSGKKSTDEIIARAESIIAEYLNKEKSKMIIDSFVYVLGWDRSEILVSDNAAEEESSASTVIEDIMRKAENGSNDACFNLGERFYYGRGGVKQDYIKAVKWYTKSAEKGDCSSQKKLADCYRSGQGVKHDLLKAVYWYEKAAEQGDYDSQKALVYCYRIGGSNLIADVEKAEKIALKYGIDADMDDSMENLFRGAESGNPGMQFKLGNAYYSGAGISADFEKAVYWYKMAAEQDYAPAQYNLACCFASGTGTKKDMTKAAELYSKAANNGELDAVNNLGALYFRGDGVPKNQRKAAELWRSAAENGLPKAQYNFGECLFNGWGVQRNFTEAAAWYKKAAELSDPDAQYSLGWCFLNGIGTAKDHSRAKRFFELSALKMNINAQKMLGYCYINGHGTERNYAKAADWFGKAAARSDKEAAKMYVYCWKYGGNFLIKNEIKAKRAADTYDIPYDEI